MASAKNTTRKPSTAKKTNVEPVTTVENVVEPIVKKELTADTNVPVRCNLRNVSMIQDGILIYSNDATGARYKWFDYGDVYVSEGKSMAANQVADIIKSQSEAYILDKANRMGLEISVEVELDNDNNSIPSSVCISGNISPYAKKVLSEYITDCLGIAKENQKWM